MKIMRSHSSMVLKEFKGKNSPIHRKFYRGLLENSALQYIRQMGSLFSSGSMKGQKEYWEWQARTAKPVKCVSYKDIPGLREKVDEFLKRGSLVVKECYYNSIKVAWAIPDVEYIEGVANLIIPIDHAWNYYKGFYFDLTAEIVLGEDVRRFEYAQVIRLNRRLMDQYVQKTKVAGGYIPEVYKEIEGR